MTTYRLMDGVAGRPGVGSSGTQPPASPTAYGGNFLAGTVFQVTSSGMWFEGYYWWVPTGGDTGAQKFALWATNGSSGAGVVIPAATVTSGTLTAGSFNYVPLASPVPIAIGTEYIACTGWSAVNGFPITNNQFNGAGAYPNGITNGPLQAFSDGSAGGGSPTAYYNFPQGVFSVAGTDPSLTLPAGGSSSSNFWVDVAVSDTAPGGYSGSYRLYPNKYETNNNTTADSAVDYVVATEFHLSQSCSLNKIWYYSPSGTVQLATSADIWSITGADSGSIVAGTNSPSWSGAAASGWVSTSFAGVTLTAGSYKVSVYNNSGTPDQWSAKDASTNYWGSGGMGVNGITWGPLFAPGLSTASLAYIFNGSNPGSTPPYTTGSTEPGQCTFAQSGTNIYPYLYVDGLAQNYWLDVEVTPTPPPPPPAAQVFFMSSM